ncbi:hypothetical protein VHUM_00504 [Vanrija humicola]|uniref:BTB domain-containing protein n=1 Tax=Vanrija humicola TaxID=5417 RepID=A0A7D8Z1H3_VANHU|nr:hypothetical protein VHUM_00504 [Vanrija humicola]
MAWNPDNPTTGDIFGRHARTPSRGTRDAAPASTPLRRGPSSSNAFTQTPTRHGTQDRIPRPTIAGAYETKQTSFEWPVRNVRALQAQLLAGDADEDEDDPSRHEIFAGDGAYFDDLAYKLHLAHVSEQGEQDRQEPTPTEPTLVLAVIALWAKHSDLPADEALARQVFVGIKPYGNPTLGEPRWIWSMSTEALFSKRQEYLDVTLPPLGTLLENPSVAADDAFAIRIVIKHVSEPRLPPMVHANQQFISRRVTRQMAALLDSKRSGDVRFLCLEHAGLGTPVHDGSRPMARRRVIYAHSEILVHVEYFKATLHGPFMEGADSSLRTLVVDDASFNTLYWVLRWLYTDEILFSSVESVRNVMSQYAVEAEAVQKLFALESWDYLAVGDSEEPDERLDLPGAKRGSGVSDCTGRRSPSSLSVSSVASSSTVAAISNATTAPRRGSTSALATPTPRGALAKASPSKRATSPRLGTGSGQSSRKPPRSPDTAPTSPMGIGRVAYSGSATGPRRSHPTQQADPHSHPTEPPPSPSPLAVFILAHRYGLDELQALARDAVLRHLTRDTCVAALLATYHFSDLHGAILDYVTDNWAEVSASPELDRCYQEVSAGVWGEHDGGQVLLGLTRRLTGVA